jgi:Predicted AAA-ATPase
LQPKKGVFRVDKTGYIRQIDEPFQRATLSLQPRRFGKSLWLQTLSKYYDKAYKDLFGHLDIEKSPTQFHSSYYILNLDFSGLRMDSVAVFQKDLDTMINDALRDLQLHYKELSFEIAEDRAHISFMRMIADLKRFGGKV